MPDLPEENYDLTVLPGETEKSPGLAEPDTGPTYDPSKDRERLRGFIALGLLGLLAAIVVASFVFIFLHYKSDLSKLKSILDILFAPVVGLVGAATGFYFGEKSK